MFKLAIILCFAFIAYAVGDVHFIDDCLSPGKPVILYNQEVTKTGHFLQIQEENLRVPLVGFAPKNISCITVVNQMSDINGGFPYIKSGGVGYTYVDLYLKSQKNKGFDFRVTVYYDDSS
ncbi:unnamed protein product [Ceutorhynchus assimilis]|uniref:Uncharacterized protein n=1 Tax=Ceutorhynchus assimilis TaxID=467358 RepID=A0A9N9MMD9_9CUCU|nr:unnamed protein product [Ceutorhynchus assimilis]